MYFLKNVLIYIVLPSSIVGLFWMMKIIFAEPSVSTSKFRPQTVSQYKNETLLQYEGQVTKSIEFLKSNLYQMDHAKIDNLKIKEPELEQLRREAEGRDKYALKLYENAKGYNKELNNFKDEITVLLGGNNKKLSEIIQTSIEDFREQANINGWKKINSYLGKISENINALFISGDVQNYDRSQENLKEMYSLVSSVTLPKIEKDTIQEKGLNLRNSLLLIKKYERIPKKYLTSLERELVKSNEIKEQQIKSILSEVQRGERKETIESEQKRLADIIFSIMVFIFCAVLGIIVDRIEYNRVLSIASSLKYLFNPDFESRLKSARITRSYLFREEAHDKTLDNFLKDLEDRFSSYISTIEHVDGSYTDIAERLQELKLDNQELKSTVNDLSLELDDYHQINSRLLNLYNTLFPERSVEQFHKGHLIELKNKFQQLVQQNYDLHIEQIKNRDFKKILLGDLAIKFQYLHKMQTVLSQKLTLLEGAIGKLEGDLKALENSFAPYSQAIVVDLENCSKDLAEYDLTDDPKRIEMNEVLFALKNSLNAFVEQTKISPMMERRIFLITEQLDKLYQQVKLEPEIMGKKIKNTMAITNSIINSHGSIHSLISQLWAEGELIQKEISEIQLINSRFYSQIDLIENFKDSSTFVEQMQESVGTPLLDQRTKERKLLGEYQNVEYKSIEAVNLKSA